MIAFDKNLRINSTEFFNFFFIYFRCQSSTGRGTRVVHGPLHRGGATSLLHLEGWRQNDDLPGIIPWEEDPMGDRHRLPTPRPAARALIFHEGDKLQRRDVGPGGDDPVRVPLSESPNESALLLSNWLGEGHNGLKFAVLFDGPFKVDPGLFFIKFELDRH